MKDRSKVTSLELERLRERAIRKNRKARRFIKKISREIVKTTPNLRQVLQWQDKANKTSSSRGRADGKKKRFKTS